MDFFNLARFLVRFVIASMLIGILVVSIDIFTNAVKQVLSMLLAAFEQASGISLPSLVCQMGLADFLNAAFATLTSALSIYVSVFVTVFVLRYLRVAFKFYF